MKSLLQERLHASCVDLTPDGESWIILKKGYMPCPPSTFEDLWNEKPTQRPEGKIMGKPVQFPRFTQAYGMDYSFAGQTAVSKEEVPPFVHQYHASLFSGEISAAKNGTLVNWYDAEQGDYIGPHSDDERHLVKGAPIFSFTVCDSESHYRRFRLRPKRGDGKTLIVKVENGDLLIMGGRCQLTHKHEIMKPTKKANEAKGRRINVTDRLFIK